MFSFTFFMYNSNFSSIFNHHNAIYLSIMFLYVFVSFPLTYTLQP